MLGTQQTWLGEKLLEMATKKEIFKSAASGYHTHHWVVHAAKKYLSLQTKKNEIKMFEIDAEHKSFKQDEELRLCLDAQDEINFSEFDRTFENIFILKNHETLESRSISDVNAVKISLKLIDRLGSSIQKQLTLSNDGTFCAIAASGGKPYFYLIDLVKKQQHKLVSSALSQTYGPCFINGETDYVSVGGKGQVEIWDMKNNKSIKVLKIGNGSGYVNGAASTHNILALGDTKGTHLCDQIIMEFGGIWRIWWNLVELRGIRWNLDEFRGIWRDLAELG